MAKPNRKYLLIIIIVFLIPFLSFSQNHIDTVKNNAVSFIYGLPVWTTKNFSEIDPFNNGRTLNIKYQRILSRPGSFLIKSEFGLGTKRDACEFYFCPVLDFSLTTEYGIKRHFILFGLGTNFNLPEEQKGISGYYKLGYSWFFAKKAFASISVRQLIWVLADRKYFVPSDDCEECYTTTYNKWAWDLKYNVFEINLGIGLKF
ncbi:MAG: hypothetical protein GXO89_01480 [Chlorobi bacterium]|nr:hypothetical protein [Chlorobiota bacterium]